MAGWKGFVSKMSKYAIWEPKHDGHAPPNWREGMVWGLEGNPPKMCHADPSWFVDITYLVPAEALNSPNDDAVSDMSTCNKCGRRYHSAPIGFIHKCSCSGGMMVRDADAKPKDPRKSVHEALAILRDYSPDELTKHGITLAPEKDWATELWADMNMAAGFDSVRKRIDAGEMLRESEKAAIECLRTRFEQMIAERSKRDGNT